MKTMTSVNSYQDEVDDLISPLPNKSMVNLISPTKIGGLRESFIRTL
jgi:hypothetical protein